MDEGWVSPVIESNLRGGKLIRFWHFWMAIDQKRDMAACRRKASGGFPVRGEGSQDKGVNGEGGEREAKCG